MGEKKRQKKKITLVSHGLMETDIWVRHLCTKQRQLSGIQEGRGVGTFCGGWLSAVNDP